MVLFPGRTAAQRDDVADGADEELLEQAAASGPRHVVDQASWDAVDRASNQSFPASDAPPWTLGYSGQPAAGRADGGVKEVDPP